MFCSMSWLKVTNFIKAEVGGAADPASQILGLGKAGRPYFPQHAARKRGSGGSEKQPSGDPLVRLAPEADNGFDRYASCDRWTYALGAAGNAAPAFLPAPSRSIRENPADFDHVGCYHQNKGSSQGGGDKPEHLRPVRESLSG